MSSTKEATFRSAVNRYIDKNLVYYQSMGGTQTAGTPDSYYEGVEAILWVEWKFTPAANPRTLPKVTELQAEWLIRAHRNNVPVAVIEGSPNGARIYHGLSWGEGNRISNIVRSRQQTAQYIMDEVTLKVV